MPDTLADNLKIAGNQEIRGRLTGSGAPGGFFPGNQSSVGWTFDPALVVANTGALTGSDGDVILVRVKATRNALLTQVQYVIAPAGVTVANAFVGLYDTSGNRLAVSDDVSSDFEAGGLITTPFGGGFETEEITGGTVYYVAFLFGSAGTAPGLGCVGASLALNAGANVGSERVIVIAGSATALPATVTLASGAASTFSVWVSLSDGEPVIPS